MHLQGEAEHLAGAGVPALSLPPPPENWQPQGSDEPQFQSLSSIPVQPLEWLEKPILMANAFHLLAGRKNTGKGTWLALLAAHVTRGSFDREGRRFGRRVIWVSGGEDSYGFDVRPRIEVAGGNADLIAVPTLDTDIMLPEHLDVIRRWVGTPGEVGLVIIDPLGGAMWSGLSTNSDADVRPMLRALNRLADEQRTVIVGSRNVTVKGNSNGALGSILGSTAWVDLPRGVLGLFHDPKDIGLRHLLLLTANRVPAGTPGHLIRIEGVVPPWGGEPVSRMAVVGDSSEDPDALLAARPDREESSSDEAERLILSILAEQGPIESSLLDVIVSEQTGLAARTIKNIRYDRLGKQRGFTRAIPERTPGSEQIARWFCGLTEAGRAYLDALDPLQPMRPQVSSEPDPRDLPPPPRTPLPPDDDVLEDPE